MINVTKYTKQDGTSVRSHNRKDQEFPELKKVNTSELDFSKKEKKSKMSDMIKSNADMIKSNAEIFIEEEEIGVFSIILEDDNGMSILAKTNNFKIAEKKKSEYELELKKGNLLKPESSAYKDLNVDKKEVYNYVYKFLEKANKDKIKYLDDDTLVDKAIAKYGSSEEVEESSLKAFHDFYESKEFIDRVHNNKSVTLSSDQTDVLEGIVLTNRTSSLEFIFDKVREDKFFNNISDDGIKLAIKDTRKIYGDAE